MSKVLILQKLKKRDSFRDVKVSDIPSSYFNRTFSTPENTIEGNNGNLLDIYKHKRGDKPVSNAKYSKIFKKPLDDVESFQPFTWTEENGIRERTIDHERLFREIYHEYGSGCYNMYLIGGRNPPIEYIIRRTWID